MLEECENCIFQELCNEMLSAEQEVSDTEEQISNDKEKVENDV